MVITRKQITATMCLVPMAAGPILAAVDECHRPGVVTCGLAAPEPLHTHRDPPSRPLSYTPMALTTGTGTGTSSIPAMQPPDDPWPHWDNDAEPVQIYCQTGTQVGDARD
jgi:hypothetical protein